MPVDTVQGSENTLLHMEYYDSVFCTLLFITPINDFYFPQTFISIRTGKLAYHRASAETSPTDYAASPPSPNPIGQRIRSSMPGSWQTFQATSWKRRFGE